MPRPLSPEHHPTSHWSRPGNQLFSPQPPTLPPLGILAPDGETHRAEVDDRIGRTGGMHQPRWRTRGWEAGQGSRTNDCGRYEGAVESLCSLRGTGLCAGKMRGCLAQAACRGPEAKPSLT